MTHTNNGMHDPSEASPPKKKRARKKKCPSLPEGIRIVPVGDHGDGKRGRLAAELVAREPRFLLKPWIPSGMLSLVVGLPGVGKSTFMAWLIAQAGCAAVLPGYEEEVEVTTLPRLEANGANLRLVRFLDDREYRLPRDKAKIASILHGWEAQLLVIDPIDSYMEESMNENVGRDVRSMLEAASWIAADTGAAVVGVRHPGKDRHNVMPGSRQWRAVPRSIVELTSDGGTPPRLLIRAYKDSLGQDARPTQYKLEGERGKPRRFKLDKELDAAIADLALVSDGPTGRAKVMEACRLIRHMFEQEEEPTVQDLVNQCRQLGIGEHARDEAKRLLGIVPTPVTSGGKWIMKRWSKDWPGWLKE